MDSAASLTVADNLRVESQKARVLDFGSNLMDQADL